MMADVQWREVDPQVKLCTWIMSATNRPQLSGGAQDV